MDVTELRGGIYRDRRWARSMTQPMVVATTADQLGSRLLFRGYGVSPSARPIHAALIACDSTILLDEAHCTRALAQSLTAIRKYSAPTRHSGLWHAPPMRYTQMTATPAEPVGERFELDADDSKNETLRGAECFEASQLRSTKAKGAKFAAEIAELAIDAVDGSHKAVGIIVNRVQTARDVYSYLSQKRPDDACHLVIGRMRPLDRDVLTTDLRSVVGPDRPDALPRPCFVIATQCLEVGADYDFDALVTECASIDALRQRFGRLNRKARDIAASASIIVSESALKPDDPVYGYAMRETWTWLNEVASNETVDFGIAAFKQRWDSLNFGRKPKLLAPSPDAAVLLPAHLDVLCQTQPEPEPSPDVSFFIHGPQRDNLEVQVCCAPTLEPMRRSGQQSSACCRQHPQSV